MSVLTSAVFPVSVSALASAGCVLCVYECPYLCWVCSLCLLVALPVLAVISVSVRALTSTGCVLCAYECSRLCCLCSVFMVALTSTVFVLCLHCYY